MSDMLNQIMESYVNYSLSLLRYIFFFTYKLAVAIIYCGC